MRCGIIFFLAVFVILAASAFADTEISIEPIKNSITLTETASFRLSLTNNAAEKQRYSLFSFAQGWDIEPSPLKDKIIEIPPNQTKTTLIKIKPIVSFDPGLYTLALNIETDLGEKYTKGLSLYLSPDQPIDYLPSIKVTPDFKKKLNPQETQTLRLFLENRNPLDIPSLVIRLQSDLPEFNEEITISLPPLEKKNIEFTIVPYPHQSPGKYFLFFVFEKDGESVKVLSQEIEILPLDLEFQTEIAEEHSFLKTVKKILVKNTGNIASTKSVRIPVSFWQSLFTYSSAETVREDSQRYLFWELTLSPEETITLTATRNYRYPFYFFFVLLVLALIYLYLRSPLSLTKSALSTKKDATLSDLKITLHLKNLTKKPLKNIEVLDLIPGIADIEKSLDIGTLRPQEIKHTKKGTLVKWHLAEIEAKEDRLITYKVRSHLKILGTFKLPRAKLVYIKKGRKRNVYSNTFRISS